MRFDPFLTPWRQLPLLLAFAAATTISACGGGGGGGSDGEGTARVFLTDAPACGYDQVNVTVERVRMHRSEDAADADGGWAEVVLSPARKIDLLELSNGVLEELGSTALPAGNYTQVRLVLVENGGAAPLANSLVLSGGDGSEVALDTPSAQQSGLKINTNFAVAAGEVADLVLDFDACRSVVTRGSSGRFNLKPVLAAVPVFGTAGQAIEGFLADGLAGATVSAQVDGVPVKSTVAALDGDAVGFVLSPLPAGSYDVVFTAPGRASAVVTSVPVTETARTQLASADTPIELAASAERSAAGVVSKTGSGAVPDATVRALQALDGGPSIELVARPVDAVTGGYSFTLPVGAPGRAAYAEGATAYSFAPDATAAALYTLEASATGEVTQEADIDLGAADANVDLVFP